MRAFLRTVAVFIACASAPAFAQVQPGQGVQQQGAVTANNCAAWAANGVVKDAGAACGSGGTGTVTSVSVTTQNGVSATVANPTTTPALGFSLGAITPSSAAVGAGSAITSSGPGGALTALGFTAPGTGVATALGVNVGTAGSVLVNGGALGTPSSGTLTNATGLPVGAVTGLGTGTATALGVNVGSAGAFVANGGALGTPSSGTATNLTGTASGLTAGTVTTNANLTGVVTSSGNATSYAATGWTGYTPTVTATSGTFTTTSAVGARFVFGKTVFFTMTITVTTVGAAAGSIVASLPFQADTSGYAYAGRETTATGKTFAGVISGSASTIVLAFYDNTSTASQTGNYTISGMYGTP